MSTTPDEKTAQLLNSVGILAEWHQRHVYTTAFENGPPQANADIAVDADLQWEIQGTNATSLSSAVHAEGGGIRMVTAGADDDQVILFPHADTQQGSIADLNFATDDEPAFAASITTGDAITLSTIYAGFVLTSAVDETTDANQAKFTYDTDDSDANWQANWSIAGTDTEIDTGISVEADTNYLLVLRINSSREAQFLIGKGDSPLEIVATSGSLTTGVDLVPYVAVQARTGAARHIELRRLSLSKVWND